MRDPARRAQEKRERNSTDILALVSVGAIAAFVTLLCYAAAKTPQARDLIAPVVVGLGAGGLILFRQLRKAASSMAASEARAIYAATHDALTRLPNRTLFNERLAEAAATKGKERVNVFCIGLDRFDDVVELLGVAPTERVIVELAARLVRLSGSRDTAARLGDGVFALLRWDEGWPEPNTFASQLVDQLTECGDGPAELSFFSASVGMGEVGADADNSLEALRHAQIALSHARKQGAAKWASFEPKMDQALQRQKALESDLRRALEEDGLSLVYQPQVNAKGVIVGAEALIRWTSPEHGVVPPSVFVPLAESCGLSEAIGCFALKRAFRDSANWSGVTVAVNLAAPHIRSGQAVETLEALLIETGRNAQDFEIEITESLLLADEPETLQTLGAIRKLGFSIALDDFGTGYSSLSYLRRFPVDKIKIDQSFIAQLGRRPESSAIVKAIIDLAEALELKVLAEGVETEDQAGRLARLGCGLYQGYFFSRPVEADKIGELVAANKALAA
ncbi:MAG TPA: phosphodiesterase [Caulobacteraceae bacterium]|nr:phosphodiesterase [Caulobacteraceae bacterium]